MNNHTDTPEWPTWRTPPKPEKGAISPEDAKIPGRIAAQYFRERDRTDTLPPPDAYIADWIPARIRRYGHTTGHVTANVKDKADDYTPIFYADTVRRLIAERDERIKRLTEALAALERTAGQPAAYDDPVRVNARAALGGTNGR